jgi:hypothetical protein
MRLFVPFNLVSTLHAENIKKTRTSRGQYSIDPFTHVDYGAKIRWPHQIPFKLPVTPGGNFRLLVGIPGDLPDA